MIARWSFHSCAAIDPNPISDRNSCRKSANTFRKLTPNFTGGCSGFDGGVEAEIAGGCAYHPKNGQPYKLKNNNKTVLLAA